ncbi:TOBE domain protein [compost metagenome]
MLLRADDVIHDDNAEVKAQIVRKSFRGSEFLYTMRLASGQTVMAHVPSHHNHEIGEWVGMALAMEHVVAFPREK